MAALYSILWHSILSHEVAVISAEILLCDVVFTLSINIIARTSATSWPDFKRLIFFQLVYSFYCHDYSFSLTWKKATLF